MLQQARFNTNPKVQKVDGMSLCESCGTGKITLTGGTLCDVCYRRKLIGDVSTLRSRLAIAEEGLKKIENNEGESCSRCEGNGKLWADGQAHSPNYGGATVLCGQCGGEGKTYLESKEIATSVLAKMNEGKG